VTFVNWDGPNLASNQGWPIIMAVVQLGFFGPIGKACLRAVSYAQDT